jgi:hypothetical protein
VSNCSNENMKLTWRSEIVQIVTAAMEAAWLSPVLLVFSYGLGASSAGVVGLPLFLLLFATRLTGRYLVESRLDLGRSRMLLVYLAAASLAIAVKIQVYPSFSWLSTAWLSQFAGDLLSLGPAAGPIILTIGTVIYAWWRSVQPAVVRPQSFYLFRQFQVGLLLVLISAFLADRSGLGATFVPWIFWLFFWGLLSIAVTRLEDIARRRRTPVESYWLPIVAAATLLILVVGGAISLAYSHEMSVAVHVLLQVLGRLYDLVVTIVFIPLQWLFAFLAFLFRPLWRWLLAQMQQNPQQQQEPIQAPANPLDELQKQAAHLPGPLADVLKLAVVVLVAVLLFFLLARSLRRRFAREEGGEDEEHESVWSAAEFWAGLRRLWRRLLYALGIGREKATLRPIAPLVEENRAASSIRQIYQYLLDLAAGLGHPRAVAITPYEYLPSLAVLLPANHADLQAITDAYVRARYGALGDAHDLEATQAAWQRVKEEAARLKLG